MVLMIAVLVELGDGFVLDYRLTSPPRIAQHYIETNHKVRELHNLQAISFSCFHRVRPISSLGPIVLAAAELKLQGW